MPWDLGEVLSCVAVSAYSANKRDILGRNLAFDSIQVTHWEINLASFNELDIYTRDYRFFLNFVHRPVF
jgi:hypothetical protein